MHFVLLCCCDTKWIIKKDNGIFSIPNSIPNSIPKEFNELEDLLVTYNLNIKLEKDETYTDVVKENIKILQSSTTGLDTHYNIASKVINNKAEMDSIIRGEKVFCYIIETTKYTVNSSNKKTPVVKWTTHKINLLNAKKHIIFLNKSKHIIQERFCPKQCEFYSEKYLIGALLKTRANIMIMITKHLPSRTLKSGFLYCTDKKDGFTDAIRQSKELSLLEYREAIFSLYRVLSSEQCKRLQYFLTESGSTNDISPQKEWVHNTLETSA